MNIYLDIDGVLLANENHASNYADDFLQAILTKNPDTTYWLTTHNWRGENRAIEILTPHLKPETVSLLDKIKPTKWGELKTDAINFEQDFLWFDDDLWPEELKSTRKTRSNQTLHSVLVDMMKGNNTCSHTPAIHAMSLRRYLLHYLMNLVFYSIRTQTNHA